MCFYLCANTNIDLIILILNISKVFYLDAESYGLGAGRMSGGRTDGRVADGRTDGRMF